MIKPKEQGWLGFQDSCLFNQALLARQAWRLLQAPESLCARVLQPKYYPGSNILSAVSTPNMSYTWRSILYGRELVKAGVRWGIANGQNVRNWQDIWIVREPTAGLISHMGRCRHKLMGL